MSKKILLISVAILVIAAVGILAFKYTFRESEKSVGSEPAMASLSASQLLRTYEENEDSANRLYLGKVISVTGVIYSFSEDSVSISVYLKEPEDFSGVMCVFDKSEIDPGSLMAGMDASLKGICSGYLFDVILNKCTLED